MWNLSVDYTEEALQQDLFKIDFTPDLIRGTSLLPGCFILVFRTHPVEAWQTQIGFNNQRTEYLSDNGDNVRVVVWTTEGSWSDQEVPDIIRTAHAHFLLSYSHSLRS